MIKYLAFFIFFSLEIIPSFGEDTIVKNNRLVPILVASPAIYGLGIVGMNELWYKENPRSHFHFFNDINEWKQMDKAGHIYSAFFQSMYGIKILEWTGLKKNKSIFWGSLTGILLQSPIEILDGYSAQYGASVSDLGANVLGSGIVLFQYIIWDEIRIQPKFSFHPTSYSAMRPNVLGKNFFGKVLKDYNGQTYWLSVNVHSFLNKQSNFPKWFNISIGYGAENMLYANAETNKISGRNSFRQYYLSFDIDLTKIKSKSKVINSILYSFNLLHIPAPAIEFNKFGIKFHPLYY